MQLRSIVLGITSLFVAGGVLAVPAGRVLSVTGEATLIRADKNVQLAPGKEIENGDLIVVGKKSTLQLRFTDDSIVSLHPNTEFRIDDYRYERNPESDRSFLNLIKGGLRTITGAIGKANQQNYSVKTEAANIGIRGTHYVLVDCNNNCLNSDGSVAPNGLFGGVTDGRIAVSNASGVTEFGQQEYFHVLTPNSPAERLIAPPSFVTTTTLAVRERGTKGVALAQGAVADAVQSTSAVQMSTSPAVAQISAVQAQQPSALPPSTELAAQTQVSGTQLIGYASMGGNAASSNVDLYPEALVLSSADFAAAGLAGATSPAALARAMAAAGVTASYNSQADAYWAYEPADSSDPANNIGWHHAWGAPVSNMPTSGMAQYAYVGGTNPTDSLGRVGTFTGSTLSMNFTTQQITNLSAMQMSFAAAGNVAATTVTFAANQTWSTASNSYQSIAASCSAGCAITSGLTNGIFLGDAAKALAASIGVAGTVNNGATSYAAGGVAVFAKQ